MLSAARSGRTSRRQPGYSSGPSKADPPRDGTGLGGFSSTADRPRIRTWYIWTLLLFFSFVHAAPDSTSRQSSQQIGDEDGILIGIAVSTVMVNPAADPAAAAAAANQETQTKLNHLIEGMQALMQAFHVKLSQPPPFPPFNADNEEWDSYLGRLQQHFAAYGIANDQLKKQWFVSWMPASQFQLLTKLSPQVDPTQLSFPQICALLQKYHERQTHIISARLEFYNCTKRPTQTYRTWAAELQGLAKRCRFVTTSGESYADSMIRDTILRNAPDRGFRLQALQLENPTTEELVTLAQAFVTSREAGRQVEHWGRSALRLNIRPAREEPMDLDLTSRRPRKTNIRQAGREAGNPNLRRPARPGQLPSCPACFNTHTRAQCPHRWATCDTCGKTGHTGAVCRQRSTTDPSTCSDAESDTFQVNSAFDIQCCKIFVEAVVQNHTVKFQLDTGSVASLINFDTYLSLGSPPLSKATVQLVSYNMKEIPLLGQVRLPVKIEELERKITLLVAKGPRAGNLLGLDAFRAFNYQIIRSPSVVFKIDITQYQNNLRQQFPTLFAEDLGCARNFFAHIQLRKNATPKYFKARPVPASLEGPVKAELTRLQERGVITPIRHSDWATPVVIVHKPNGKLRLCGDFKVTVNSQTEIDTYPMPRPEELYNKLAGCSFFSRIDLAEAYLQLPLDEASKKCLVINTTSGLFQFNRLVFGVASAPAIFQRYMEQLLRGLPLCVTYLDDVLVAGRTEEEHDQNLKLLLQRLQDNGLRCNLDKCSFRQTSITYLGYILSREGLHPSRENIAALELLPQPKNLKQVQAFIGKISYYRRFIPQAADIMKPLTELTKKGKTFEWTPACEQAFKVLKEKLKSAPLLSSYQPDLPLVLAADASDVGLGAVLSHIFPDGTERPIAFVSKTLNDAQRRYSQIEKEALAIVFGITKFNHYLYGNKFQLVTDHRPLISLFNPATKLPERTAHRLLRWALFLQKYQYTIIHKKSNDHGNADALSRLPCGPDPSFDQDELMCCHIDEDAEDTVTSFPIMASEVARATARDPILKQVLEYTQKSWPAQLQKDQHHLLPYWRRREQIVVKKGVLLLQTETTQHRVIIPEVLRPRILKMLHEGHWGLARTKATARAHVFWPKLDREIESTVRHCQACAAQQAAPAHKFTPWPTTTEPWERVHADFAGPFHNKMWLIIVDAFSKFPFVFKCQSTTTTSTIKKFQEVFALEGLPKTLVTDNGPQFRSAEFKRFCQENGIQLMHSPPFHPQSNGVAERLVRTFKSQLQKLTSDQNIDTSLLKFLSSYRATPTADGSSPAQKFHGRQPRTILHLLSPEATPKPAAPQHKYRPGTPVWARGFGPRANWKEGVILECLGRRICRVKVGDSTVLRHQNQLRPRAASAQPRQQPRRSPRLAQRRDTYWLPPPISPLPPNPSDALFPQESQLPVMEPPPAPPMPQPPTPGPSRVPSPPPRDVAPPPPPPAPHRVSRRHFSPYAPVAARRLTEPDTAWAAASGGRSAVRTGPSGRAPHLNSAGRGFPRDRRVRSSIKHR